jgi:hypothetical protein
MLLFLSTGQLHFLIFLMLVRRRIRIDKERYDFVKTNPDFLGLLVIPDPGSVSGSWFLKERKTTNLTVLFFFLYHYQRLSSTPVLQSEHPTYQDMRSFIFLSPVS